MNASKAEFSPTCGRQKEKSAIQVQGGYSALLWPLKAVRAHGKKWWPLEAESGSRLSARKEREFHSCNYNHLDSSDS